MYHIEIFAVGSQKNEYLQGLIQEYAKRLHGLINIQLHTIDGVMFRSPTEQTRVRAQEMERLLKRVPQDSIKILLTETGKTLDSSSFAQSLPTWSENGTRHLSFLIAGPLGHDRMLEKQVNHCLSLSPMTFPHELAQVVLLEQIYRAMTILKGKTYHY